MDIRGIEVPKTRGTFQHDGVTYGVFATFDEEAYTAHVLKDGEVIAQLSLRHDDVLGMMELGGVEELIERAKKMVTEE